MLFKGITKKFKLTNEQQYNTIGQFWDEMSLLYGLENIIGLGYKWTNDEIYYAIGLKNGEIPSFNFTMLLPEEGWTVVEGRTELLKEIYDDIYINGPLDIEIETFDSNGNCKIMYYRNKSSCLDTLKNN